MVNRNEHDALMLLVIDRVSYFTASPDGVFFFCLVLFFFCLFLYPCSYRGEDSSHLYQSWPWSAFLVEMDWSNKMRRRRLKWIGNKMRLRRLKIKFNEGEGIFWRGIDRAIEQSSNRQEGIFIQDIFKHLNSTTCHQSCSKGRWIWFREDLSAFTIDKRLPLTLRYT